MAGLLDKATTTLGFALHLAPGAVFLTMGLLVPAWFVVVLLVVWVGMVAVAIARREHERYLVLAPLVALGLLAVAVTLGEVALGWTA